MKPYAALFPGQGAQHPGMGKDLAAASEPAAAAFREAGAAVGFDLESLCFGGTADELARTEITQPAILTHAVAAYRAYAARGGAPPAAAAGHSLGEYAAHVIADTLSLSEAVRSVHRRGRFMQEAVPEGVGAMAAVLGIDREALVAICAAQAQGEVVSCANFNAPGQIAISGHAGAVDRAVAAAVASGAKRAMRLAVSAPFHCALMEPAAVRLRPVLAEVAFRDPALPVYTNADAAPVRTAAAARDALVRQVVAPVLWEDEILRMVSDGIDTFVEFGPGKVLAGLVRRIHAAATVVSAGDPAGVDAALALVKA